MMQFATCPLFQATMEVFPLFYSQGLTDTIKRAYPLLGKEKKLAVVERQANWLDLH